MFFTFSENSPSPLTYHPNQAANHGLTNISHYLWLNSWRLWFGLNAAGGACVSPGTLCPEHRTQQSRSTPGSSRSTAETPPTLSPDSFWQESCLNQAWEGSPPRARGAQQRSWGKWGQWMGSSVFAKLRAPMGHVSPPPEPPVRVRAAPGPPLCFLPPENRSTRVINMSVKGM